MRNVSDILLKVKSDKVKKLTNGQRSLLFHFFTFFRLLKQLIRIYEQRNSEPNQNDAERNRQNAREKEKNKSENCQRRTAEQINSRFHCAERTPPIGNRRTERAADGNRGW